MEPYFHLPAPEKSLRHHFNQYPVDESLSPQTPFVVNNYVNQTLELESALSRLNLSSSSPYYTYTGFNGGGGGVLFGNQENDSFEGRFGSSCSNGNRGFSQNFQNPQNGYVYVPDFMNQNGLMGYDYSMDNRRFRDESIVLKGLSGSTSSSNNDYHDGMFKKQLDQICLKDLRGQIVSLAIDQYGSRLLQMKFENVNVDEIDMIFGEVIEHVSELMMDQFGNYLIQKLVEVCSEEQRTEILLAITNTESRLVCLCLNIHGTRAVQKLLKFLTTPQQISLLMLAITHGAVRLMKDMNGHHVIKHCLKHFPYEDTKSFIQVSMEEPQRSVLTCNDDVRYLLKEVAEHCVNIATDKSGCCVLPTCVEASRGEQRERLFAVIIGNALVLAEDRYGNYIVQYLLGLKMDRVTCSLIRRFEGNYFTLSCNKYGSNVVEKCLTDSAEDQSRIIIMELLRNPNIFILLNDPFGNYVFQSALAVSKGVVHNALVKLVETHSLSMRNNLYGKKILSWFEKKKNCNTYRSIKRR